MTEIPTTEAVDPDLEQRVEQDLQRVQELIESSPFEADTSSTAAAGSVDVPDETASLLADTTPTLIQFDRPDFFPASGSSTPEGSVTVSVLVDEGGRVIDSLLISGLSQYPGLNDAILDAARRASFEPGTRNGEPAQMWYEFSVDYEE